MKITTEEQMMNVPKGSYIKATTRDGRKVEGVHQFVWWCLDELAMSLLFASGESISVFPCFGDDVEIREESVAQ